MSDRRVAGRTSSAPQPAGPYSQAVRLGNVVACAGQAGIRPDGSVATTFDEQVHQTFANLRATLASCDVTFDDVIQVRVFMTEITDFDAMNAIYREYFSEPYPARTTVYVTLPDPLAIEVDCLAIS